VTGARDTIVHACGRSAAPTGVRLVILPLFYRCDGRCKMCSVWRRPGVASWEPAVLRRVLSDPLLAQSVEVVNVTGGEPALREDLHEVVQAVVQPLEALHTLSLQTNGLNPRAAEGRIIPAVEWILSLSSEGRHIHVDVNVSLDGPDVIHDTVRGREGAFSSVVETIELLRSALATTDDVTIMLNCTIVRQNVAHLHETQDIADELGVAITYTVPQETDIYMVNDDAADEFLLSQEQRLQASSFVRDIVRENRVGVAMSLRYCRMLIELLETGRRNIGCPLAAQGLFMEPDGSASPCWRSAELRLGNVLVSDVSTLLEVRDSPEYQQKLDALCADCPSNCYVDWTRQMLARRVGRTAS